MGWPLRGGKRFREFGGSFIYPLGDDKVAIGMVVGLDYTDATLSVHDLLQELKTHPFVRGILAGGTRVAWGAKTIPEGGFQALPERFSFPGGMIVGDSAGFVNVPALKGVHYAMKSGMLAAEAAFDAVGPGRTSWAPGALDAYDEGVRSSYVWSDLRARSQHASRVQARLRPGRADGRPLAHHVRQDPAGHDGARLATRTSPSTWAIGPRAIRSPTASSSSTSSRASILSGNKTRDDAPSHIRVDTKVRREVAETWAHMCPAQVYEVAGEASPAGNVVDVEVTASNCVQCGAITAKGGRLTPPEGGDGPEYSLM